MRIVTIDSPHGAWTYSEWRPAHLAGLVEVVWHSIGTASEPRNRHVPDGTLELLMNLGDPFRLLAPRGAEVFRATWLSGVQSGPVVTEQPRRQSVLGVRLRPAGAYAALGLPLAELAGLVDRSMAELTTRISRAVAAAYDFSGMRTVVDVGGGHGALLQSILVAHPALRGIVFDLPHCSDGARELAERAGLASRIEFAGGSFFEDALPGGADAYLVKSVIHDWDDERSGMILRACRRAMREGSRLLVLECIIPARVGSSPLESMLMFSDLNMLVMTGGRERTEPEYRALIESAGLRVERILATPSAYSVIEALPV